MSFGVHDIFITTTRASVEGAVCAHHTNKSNNLSLMARKQTLARGERGGLSLVLGSKNRLNSILLQSEKRDETPKTNGVHKRQDEKKKQVSTPILKLRKQTNILDQYPAPEFDDLPSAKRPKRGRGKPRQLSLPITTQYDYEEQVSHHTLELQDDLKGRRTSYHNRGKRVSSIGNGFEGEPHDSVDVSEYYKFLNNLMPDPNRMRQLLIWCFKRALQNQPHVPETARGIAKVITDEILEGLTNGHISTSWYNRPAHAEADVKTVVPNPLNVANEENVRLFQEKLADLKKQRQQWDAAYKRALKPLEGIAVKQDVSLPALTKYLEANNQKEYEPAVLGQLISLLQQQADNYDPGARLETQVDTLRHALYQMLLAVGMSARVQSSTLDPAVNAVVQQCVGKPCDLEFLRGLTKVKHNQ